MAEIQIDFEMPCRGCGYNLRGLEPGGRCPECGQSVMESVRGYVDGSDLVAEQRRRISAQPTGFLRWALLAASFALVSHTMMWTTVLLVKGAVDVSDRLDWAPWWATLGSVAGGGAVAFSAFAVGVLQASGVVGGGSMMWRVRVWTVVCGVVAAAYPLSFLMIAASGAFDRDSWQSVAIGGMTAATMAAAVLRWVYMSSWLRGWKWSRLGWGSLVAAILLGIIGALWTMGGSQSVSYRWGMNASPTARSMIVPNATGVIAPLIQTGIDEFSGFRNGPELVISVSLLALYVFMFITDGVVGYLVWSELRRRKGTAGRDTHAQ